MARAEGREGAGGYQRAATIVKPMLPNIAATDLIGNRTAAGQHGGPPSRRKMTPPVDRPRKRIALGVPSPQNQAPSQHRDQDHDEDQTPSQLQPQHKIAKRRAARACVMCRARKVRCDVVEGAPCGNCRWDGVQCVVQESRRRRKTPACLASCLTGHGSYPFTTPLIDSVLHLKTGPDSESDIGLNMNGSRRLSSTNSCHSVMDGSYQVRTLQYQPPVFPFKTESGSKPDSSDTVESASSQQMLLSATLETSKSSCGAGGPPQHVPGSPASPQPMEQIPLGLPAFLKPLPTRLAVEEVALLRARQALVIPPAELQARLLRAYVDYVDPYMPVVELREFLAAVGASDGSCGRVSLLLYQAVLFAATAFVPAECLAQAGYTSRRAARKVFFKKTRLLYDLDCESDRLVLLQTVLLMTYWYDTPDDQKDTWHWMGVAVSLAHTIGLHRDPLAAGSPTAASPRTRRLWRRIWWSCLMRDRLIALGMRRPTRIKEEDFDVPMLEESDFDLGYLPDPHAQQQQQRQRQAPPLREAAAQHELALLCIAKVRLCLCIGMVLREQHSVIQAATGHDAKGSADAEAKACSVRAVEAELERWLKCLPECCHYQPPSGIEWGAGTSAGAGAGADASVDTKPVEQPTIAVQRALLHMIYHTAMSALYRPQLLAPPRYRAAMERHQISRIRGRCAAAHVSRIAADLHAAGLDGFLPTTGVTVVLPAMMVHLLDLRSPGGNGDGIKSEEEAVIRYEAGRGFRDCMRVMQQLRETYTAADYAVGFLDMLVRQSGAECGTAPICTASVRTPPPESATFASTPHLAPMAFSSGTFFPTAAAAAAAATAAASASATTPTLDNWPLAADGMPQVLTPSASWASEEVDMLLAPIYGGDGAGMAEEGCGAWTESVEPIEPDLDLDQWLQFPVDGSGSATGVGLP